MHDYTKNCVENKIVSQSQDCLLSESQRPKYRWNLEYRDTYFNCKDKCLNAL